MEVYGISGEDMRNRGSVSIALRKYLPLMQRLYLVDTLFTISSRCYFEAYSNVYLIGSLISGVEKNSKM